MLFKGTIIVGLILFLMLGLTGGINCSVDSWQNSRLYVSANMGSYSAIAIPEMIIVVAGTTADDRISLPYNLEIGRYEVTFAGYISYCRQTDKSIPDDEGWGQERRPVINVSWYDAVQYCNWLSEQKGYQLPYDVSGPKKTWSLKDKPENLKGYRLPTENEWKYVVRGGNKGKITVYAGSDNIEDVAWYADNSNKTQPVGEKQANELGVYDMSGNVLEWTNNVVGSYRVVRGGSWYFNPDFCEVNFKNLYFPPHFRDYDIGFRISRTN